MAVSRTDTFALVRLLCVFTLLGAWGSHISFARLAGRETVLVVAFGLLLTGLMAVSWVFGIWFKMLGTLSGFSDGQKLVSFLVPVAPMWLVGLPVIGLDMLSVEWVAFCVVSYGLHLNLNDVYRLIWAFKRGWRATLPDSGKVPGSTYREVYHRLIFIYAALPLIWLAINAFRVS